MVAGLVAGALGLLSVTHTLIPVNAQWLDSIRGGSNSAGADGATPREPGVERVVAEGRIVSYPGAEVVVASEAPGRLVNVRVVEGQKVEKGDLIAEIGADELHAALAEAQWKAAECDADIHLWKWKLARVTQLNATQVVAGQEVREFQRNLDAARAQRNFAGATAKRFEAQIAKTRILAPISGAVVIRWAHAGQMVQTSTPIVTIADLNRTRVEVEVNEFDGCRVRLGGSAVVTAEGLPGRQWAARVEEIPDVIVNRNLRPQDPGRPSDTGVLLVKLKLLEKAPLKLGQRVEIEIEVAPANAPVAGAGPTNPAN